MATLAATRRTVARKQKKLPLDIDWMMSQIQSAVEPFPKAALFELYDQGYKSPFEQLLACIISIRTRDEVTVPVAKALFNHARTPAEILSLSLKELDHLIDRCTFHEGKARQIQKIAKQLIEEHQGELPCDLETLLSMHGVGPKTAHLVLGIACHQPHIGVDIHVHRITNRWGYVQTSSPEKTTLSLEKILPRKYWVKINELLVPFGKHICTGTLPKCSSCPVYAMCQQVGIAAHR